MEIENVQASGKTSVSLALRLAGPAALIGLGTIFAVNGILIGGVIATVLATAIAFFFLPVRGHDFSSKMDNAYFDLIEDMHPKLNYWRRYDSLYADDLNAVLGNMYKLFDQKSIDKAILLGKTYSVDIHETRKDSFGGYTKYRLTFKGKQWSLSQVRVPSEIELWRDARLAATKIK